MLSPRTFAAALIGAALATPLQAQTTLTYSSWVPPTHHLTIWQQNWTKEAEKATGGRVKFQELPKAPAAPPGTFDAVRDGLVDLSYVTASYTPARHILPLMAELPGAGDTAEITRSPTPASTGSTSRNTASTRACTCSRYGPTARARCSPRSRSTRSTTSRT